MTPSAEECRELLHLTQELDKDKVCNVRALLEANIPRIIDVANEQLNLVDSSSKAHRPAGNSMSILALLMMGAGCRLPHGLKSAILHGIQQDQFAKHYAPRQQLMQEFGQVVGGYDARGGSVVEWPIAGAPQSQCPLGRRILNARQRVSASGELLLWCVGGRERARTRFCEIYTPPQI
jgi:hypothetical protein